MVLLPSSYALKEPFDSSLHVPMVFDLNSPVYKVQCAEVVRLSQVIWMCIRFPNLMGHS